MGELTLARIVAILACAGLIWIGIGFAGFALTTWLTPYLTLAGAAAATALLLVVAGLCLLLIQGRTSAGFGTTKESDSVLSAIALIAKERPILAVIGAAIFGASEVFFSPRRNKK